MKLREWLCDTEHRLQHWGSPFFSPWYRRPLYWVGGWIYKARRLAEGARSVRCGETYGTFVDEHTGESITFGGMCPVQAECDFQGRDLYYRSRGEGWQLHISKLGGEALNKDSWSYSERLYFFPDGGYVDSSVSCACIAKGIAKWREAGCP